MTSDLQVGIDTLEAAVAYLDWVRSLDDLEPTKQNAAVAMLGAVADYLTDHLADVLHTTETPNYYALEMARGLNKEKKR